MAAAAVASPNGQASGQSAFSPIALFECTISNAQMLVESMELADLVLALKIVSQLHGRVVEVMEPSATRAQQLAELYCRHFSDTVAPAVTDQSDATDSAKSPVVADPGVKREHPPPESDDDDLEMLDLEEAGIGWPETPTRRQLHEQPQNHNHLHQQHPQQLHEQPQNLNHLQQQLSQPPTVRDSPAGSRGLSESWKLLLRKAYRMLKAEGITLFDFTKSYSAPANLQAADMIINRAVAMSSKPQPDIKSWQPHEPCSLDQCRRYLSDYYRMTLKKPNRTQIVTKQAKKLSRRQRSFDNLATQGVLTPIERLKMQAILGRDYTSSDEEEPDGGIRVKQLTWETPEVTRLKSLLDRHFSEVIANPKERQELQRLRRGGVSGRTPPENPVDWAVNWAAVRSDA